jgi:hypothetical protein
MSSTWKRLASFVFGLRAARWQRKTLVVGPVQPVDGDSVACTKALISHRRQQGLEAYTLPTRAMYAQLAWILEQADYHPASLSLASVDFTTDDLQAAYDAVLKVWRPDEVLLVDGCKLGFDSRGIKVFTIDHHVNGVEVRDDDDAFIQAAPSAGCLLIDRYSIFDPILAVSILTDTFWLRHNQPATASRYLAILAENGLTDAMLIEMQEKLMVRKDPRIVLGLQQADLRFAGDCAMAVLKTVDLEVHRGVMGELGYFAKHVCVVRADGYVSFKTVDQSIDLRPLATKYGGGGHPTIAAAQMKSARPDVIESLFLDFQSSVRCTK